MCGRYTLTAKSQELATLFDLSTAPELPSRYNIAPTQPVIAVRLAYNSAQREIAIMRWGLIPSWAKDISIGSSLINARAETLAEKPAFRSAFRRRRCLIPGNGFYEWQKQGTRKQPYLIGMDDKAVFAFAGLWEHWESADGELDTCTIITTSPNELVEPLHNRMPVILDPIDFTAWLDPATPSDELMHLLRPYPAAPMTAFAVSTAVNSPANDTPDCIRPLS